jgi:predicted phage-related endonuclease
MNLQSFPDRESWLNARHVGGSDVAVILGVSHWSTPYDLWLVKTSRAQRLPQTPWQAFGHLVEDALIEDWCARNGWERHPESPTLLLIQGPEPWQTMSPDDIVHRMDGASAPDSGEYIIAGLDAKFYRYPAKSDGWGEAGTDEVPVDIYLQMQWGMHCSGLDEWHVVAAFHQVAEIRDYVIRRDDVVIDHIVEKCGAWHQKHIIEDIAPELQVGPVANLFHGSVAQTGSGSRRATEAERETIKAREAARQQRLDAKKLQALLDLQLKEAIGEDEGLWHDDCRATWKTAANGSRRLNTKVWDIDTDLKENQ